jgi:spoIIIJ-associated protein
VAPERDPDDRAANEGTAGAGTGGEFEATADPAEIQRLADRLLRGLGLEIQSTARESGETIEVDLSGPDREYLLDRRGEALNAIQYLLNRIVYRGRKGKKVHVDSDGYRKVREDELVEIAQRTAEKALDRGEECVLSPLNPYERRLVHLALQDNDAVETHSLGDGFLKRVAIRPAKKSGPGKGQGDS